MPLTISVDVKVSNLSKGERVAEDGEEGQGKKIATPVLSSEGV